jgi:hypothetical protein
MLKIIRLFILAISISVAIPLKAQFVKKAQWDFTWGGLSSSSKVIDTPAGGTIDIGSIPLGCTSSTFWYNITRNISAGLQSGAMTNAIFLSTELNQDGVPKGIRYDGFHFGAFGKYHFFERKGFKAFTSAGLTHTFHISWVPTYYQLYNPPTFTSSTYKFKGTKKQTSTSLGGDFRLGITTHFSRGFGMTFQGGYLNNSYYKGPHASIGFFFAFINR